MGRMSEIPEIHRGFVIRIDNRINTHGVVMSKQAYAGDGEVEVAIMFDISLSAEGVWEKFKPKLNKAIDGLEGRNGRNKTN